VKLMILGAAYAQLNAIKRAKSDGLTVLVTDYLEDSIGKKHADEHELASTFDAEVTLEVARKHQINGIMTTGTDQPVLTVTKVAHALELPAFLSIQTAYAVTNKRAMKQIFTHKGIPTADYRIIRSNFLDEELAGLNFPVVVKPLDSQGQRGIFKLYTAEAVRRYFNEVLAHSREEEILVEAYYENDEITISGWVKEGKAKILTVTDRVTFQEEGKIGICLSHEFPSKHLNNHREEIKALTNQIVEAFNINEGPIYFQMFVGKEGIKVNEIACRIGGAYEDEVIPLLTGVDILKMTIDFSLGKVYANESYELYNLDQNKCYASIQLFFLREGKITQMPLEEDLKLIEGVYNIRYHYKLFDEVKAIHNATSRAGYAIIIGGSQEQLDNNKSMFYYKMKVLDENGYNMVIHS